ncbi:MAG: RIP metalloprotease RseP [Candidatus Aminicenantes bacterium]|nr:RIP metalloprotease RseP [Candidatus Aminicenantes bacterium]
MAFISTIMVFTVVLGIIVIVHEFGHFIAARLMGVRVETFSFGFGKRLFGKKIGDTDFRISVFPLGGYVKMAGEDEYDPDNLKTDEFQAKNRAQKIFILLMGPLMNIILALLILTIINITGVESEKYKSEPPVIGLIAEESPAKKAGLEVGDLVLNVDGYKVKDWKELELEIGSNPDNLIKIVYEREGKQFSTELMVESDNEYNIGDAGFYWKYRVMIGSVKANSPASFAGIQPDDIIYSINGDDITPFNITKIISKNPGIPLNFRIKRGESFIEKEITPQKSGERVEIGVGLIQYSPMINVKYGFFDAVSKSIKDTIRLTSLVFDAFRKMIVGKLSAKNLSGPIEIAKFSKRAFDSGLSEFFMLIAFISLQLGIVNLFPIPALDGGHLMIYSIESLIRREFSMKVKLALINVGFFILLTLMAFVILNDIAKNLPNGWNSFLPF